MLNDTRLPELPGKNPNDNMNFPPHGNLNNISMFQYMNCVHLSNIYKIYIQKVSGFQIHTIQTNNSTHSQSFKQFCIFFPC